MSRFSIKLELTTFAMTRLLSFFKLVLLLSCLMTVSIGYGQGVQIQGPRDSTGVYSGVVYGPIDSNDTLWGIASRYRQDQRFTVYQVMMAIYELNRDAFENGNFNTMVNGATLQLPSDRYIARMDPQRSKAKAERDDLAFGRTPSAMVEAQAAQPVLNNLKPEIPLVNKEDLSATERQLQNQLNSIRSQQNRLFDEIKSQMETSIDNTQAIVTNNEALLDRFNQNEQEFLEFRSTLENDFQSRLDQQSEQIRALTELVQQAQERQLAKEAESFMTTLSQPPVLIGGSALLSLFVLGGLAYWLFKRQTPQPAAPEPKEIPAQEKIEDIIDDELVIGEADDLLDNDTDELLEALGADQDDDSLLDDILSEELEESIEEVPVAEEEFAEIGDEMLVPDQPAEKVNTETSATSNESDQVDNSIALDEETADTIAEDKSPEISKDMVDDLLEEEAQQADVQAELPESPASPEDALEDELKPDKSDLPEGISLDSDGEIDEDTLSQIEASISEKEAELNSLTEEIEEGVESGVASETAPDSIAENSDISEQALETEPTSEKPESEVQVEPSQEQDEVVEEEVVSEELVQETAPTEETPAADDVVTDDTLEPDLDIKESASEEIMPNEAAFAESEETAAEEVLEAAEPPIDLTDANLNEDDDLELDAVLEDSLSSIDAEELDKQVEESEIEISEEVISIDTDEPAELDDDATQMAEELLSELEQTTEQQDDADELDQLLEEMSVDEDLVVDELLSDIPTLSEEISADIQGSTEPDSIQSEDPLEAALELDENEDVLSELPDLDSWLDEDDSAKENEQTEDGTESSDEILLDISDEEFDSTIDGLDELEQVDDDLEEISSSDTELLNEIENTDFDELLQEVEAISQGELDESQIENQALENPDLDLSALLDEQDNESATSEDFVDVDSLLEESESATPLTDEELALDLKLDIPDLGESEAAVDALDENVDQASNLDLAQVYIDMGDAEAAQETLQEVVEKGNEQQRVEAKKLLKELV